MGSNVLIIHTYDAGVIVDLMMGGDGSNPPLDLNDLHLSAISEAMNQMMGSSCTSLSQILNKRIDISPPILDLIKLDQRDILGADDQPIVKISFRVVIQGLVDSEMMQLLPVDFAKNMTSELLKNTASSDSPAIIQSAREEGSESMNAATTAHSAGPAAQASVSKSQMQVPVSPVKFEAFPQERSHFNAPTNLDLVLDVPLQVSVELGRTSKKIREILELNTGSIVELDKLAGEPVDVLVNGKYLAKGEVVIIDENFGVRVTEILSPTDRVKNLK